MIYGRGVPLTILRRATLRDVREIEERTPDAVDAEHVQAGRYVVVLYNDSGRLDVYHVGYLRADDGGREIDEAMRELAAVEHGPAPWNMVTDGVPEDQPDLRLVVDADGAPVAMVFVGTPKGQINLPLIEQAPAMLATLRHALALLENITTDTFRVGGDRQVRWAILDVLSKVGRQP